MLTPVESIKDLFLVDILGADSPLEPFSRVAGFSSIVPCYCKNKEALAYVLGEEGEYILAVAKTSKVFVPMSVLDSDLAITDRMEAILMGPGYEREAALVKDGEVDAMFVSHFPPDANIRTYRKGEWAFGVLDYAGIWVQDPATSRHGLVVFSDRILAVRSVER